MAREQELFARKSDHAGSTVDLQLAKVQAVRRLAVVKQPDHVMNTDTCAGDPGLPAADTVGSCQISVTCGGICQYVLYDRSLGAEMQVRGGSQGC